MMRNSATRSPAPLAFYALLLSSAVLGIFLFFCARPAGLRAEAAQDGTIGVIYTVGTANGYCADTSVIAVSTGTRVYFCFTIVNSTPVTLTTHTFTFTLDAPQVVVSRTFSSVLPPGEKLAVTDNFLAPAISVSLSTNVAGALTSTIAVASIDEDLNTYSDRGTARVILGQATTVITQTVGTVEGTCADTPGLAVASGTTVYYCLTIADTGTLDFVRHEIRAPQLGATFVYTPANPTLALQQITAQQVRNSYPPNQFEKVIADPFTNLITVTSYTTEGVVSQSSAAAVAIIGSASAVLTYTVGTDPNRCASTNTLSVLTNTTVYYCIQIENTGTLPLERFTISAPQLDLQRTLTRTVAAGASLVLTSSFDSALTTLVNVPQNTTVTNAITVDGYTTAGVRVRTPATATITVGGLLITVVKYARATPTGCVTAEPLNISTTTQFYYCVVVRNTGQVPITGFSLIEPAPTNINFAFDYQLGVGETMTLTNDFLATALQLGSALGPFLTTGSLNASVMVTARGSNGATVAVSDAFQINATVPTVTPVPQPTSTPTWTPTLTPIPSTTPTVPPTPTPTNVVISILPTATDPFGLSSVTTPNPGVPGDPSSGFVPESPLTDPFFETPTPFSDFFATEIAMTEAAVTAAALAIEAEATQSALLLTQQAPPFVPTSPLFATETPATVLTSTVTSLPAVALPPPDGMPAAGDGSFALSGGNGDYLTLIAATLTTSAATLGWIWFLVGSIIFFAVAGMFAGLGFRQQERGRYRIVDEEGAVRDADFDELPFGADRFDSASFAADHFATDPSVDRGVSTNAWQQTAPARRPADRDPADNDFWPTSLP